MSKKFTGFYTKEEESGLLRQVQVEAASIAEAVAVVAGHVPEGHCLQTIRGDDAYVWERGRGFVVNADWKGPSEEAPTGDPDVKIMFRWKNIEQDLIDALIKEITDLVAAKIKEQMRRNDAD